MSIDVPFYAPNIINTNTMKEGGEAAPEADNAAAENPPADEEQPLVKSEKAPTV